MIYDFFKISMTLTIATCCPPSLPPSLQAFGAKLVLTPATKGMGGSVAKAEAIVAEIGENAFMLQQFNNPDNPKVGVSTPPAPPFARRPPPPTHPPPFTSCQHLLSFVCGS